MLEHLARERDKAIIRRDEIAHSLRREEVERLARQVPPDCVVVPREPFNEALDILKRVRDGELGNCLAYRMLIAAGEVKP